MDEMWRTAARQQFGAAIDMLGNALRDCPEELWDERLWDDRDAPGLSAFWYVAYHTLFWLDLYLSGTREGFAPPDPFTLDELDPAGVLPPRAYTRAELEGYVDHCRGKCRETIETLTDDGARRPCRAGTTEMPFAELLLYNMRHVQEHAAQLSMLLGQRAGTAFRWERGSDDA